MNDWLTERNDTPPTAITIPTATTAIPLLPSHIVMHMYTFMIFDCFVISNKDITWNWLQ